MSLVMRPTLRWAAVIWSRVTPQRFYAELLRDRGFWVWGYDYGDQMAALGPLGGATDPHAHDLCAIHTDRLSVPKGWVVVRHETLRV